MLQLFECWVLHKKIDTAFQDYIEVISRVSLVEQGHTRSVKAESHLLNHLLQVIFGNLHLIENWYRREKGQQRTNLFICAHLSVFIQYLYLVL